MKKMTKTTALIWVGVLCLGLVLGGIGAGVCFADFSRFTYAGERYPDHLPVETQLLKVRTQSLTSTLLLDSYQQEMADALANPGRLTFHADDSLTPGTLTIELRYRGSGLFPEAYCREDGDGQELLLLAAWNRDSLPFLSVQDQLLEDVKNFSLGSYHTLLVEGITLTAHPTDLARLRLVNSGPVVDTALSFPTLSDTPVVSD